MNTYIVLLRFTHQGVQNIKDSPARLDAAKKAFESMGAHLKEYYLLFGQYDGVVIAEAPDDETMAKILLAIGSLGNIRTECVRAMTEGEFRKIVAGLP